MLAADGSESQQPQIIKRSEPQSSYVASGEASEKNSTVNLTGDSVRSPASPRNKESAYKNSPQKSAFKERQH